MMRKGSTSLYQVVLILIVSLLVLLALAVIIFRLLGIFVNEDPNLIAQEIIKGEIGHGGALLRIDESVEKYSHVFPLSLEKDYTLKVEGDPENFDSKVCIYDGDDALVGQCENLPNIWLEIDSDDVIDRDVGILLSYHLGMERVGQKQYKAKIIWCSRDNKQTSNALETCYGEAVDRPANRFEEIRNFCTNPPLQQEALTLFREEFENAPDDATVSAKQSLDVSGKPYIIEEDASQIEALPFQGVVSTKVGLWQDGARVFARYCDIAGFSLIREVNLGNLPSGESLSDKDFVSTSDYCDGMSVEDVQAYWVQKSITGSIVPVSLGEQKRIKVTESTVEENVITFSIDGSIELKQHSDHVYYSGTSVDAADSYYVVYCEEEDSIDYYAIE